MVAFDIVCKVCKVNIDEWGHTSLPIPFAIDIILCYFFFQFNKCDEFSFEQMELKAYLTQKSNECKRDFIVKSNTPLLIYLFIQSSWTINGFRTFNLVESSMEYNFFSLRKNRQKKCLIHLMFENI